MKNIRFSLILLSIAVCLLAHSFLQDNAVLANKETNLKVAFVRNGQLWLKEKGQEHELTREGNIRQPKWSSDGEWIAYQQGEDLWVYHIHDQKMKLIYKGLENSSVGLYSFLWAPHKNILAFQVESTLNIIDLDKVNSPGFQNVALGVDNFAWLPDESGFLVSSSANLLPDGWTNVILYTVSLNLGLIGEGLESGSTTPNVKVERFFTLPRLLQNGDIEIIPIQTSTFRWSPDHKWIAFIVSPTASLSMDSNMLCILSTDEKTFKPIGEMLSNEHWFQWGADDNLLGNIAGGGRITTGYKHKMLQITTVPGFQAETLTPDGFVDLDFSWVDKNHLISSRVPETEGPNQLRQQRLQPVLYLVDVLGKKANSTYFTASGGWGY